ncbi:MAG: NAD-dependent epimerase/dehydratase family protein [Geminicoccaceae bacterium]
MVHGTVAKPERLLVTGAGGFIGHHLVKYLVARGYWVRGVDIKRPEYERSPAHEFEVVDLRQAEACLTVTRDVAQVYHLAADMGGIGYITTERAKIARNNTMMNVHILDAARLNNVKRFLFSSSACVYPQYLQKEADVRPLREDDAWPADPEEGYGLEKLYMEKLCQYFTEDYGLETRVVRFHNVYGPLGSYDGGKEKAPAAICRKVALAAAGGTIDVWGDGKQTRSFMYVSDCVEGLHRLMQSDCRIPLNLGTDVKVTVDQLVAIVAEIAGKKVTIRHNRSMPQGVRGRNSDNTLLRHVLGWEPEVSLVEGLAPTYAWIDEQLAERRARVDDRDPARWAAELPLRESVSVA